MIKHGSGMALCLKFITNKVSSAPPLLLRRSHVSACNVQLPSQSLTSPIVQECHNNSAQCSSSQPSLNFPLGERKYGKAFSLNRDLNVIRSVSHLFFEWDKSHTTEARQSNNPCQCSDSVSGISCQERTCNIKLDCVQENSANLDENRRHKDSVSYLSSVENQNYASENKEEDSNLRGTDKASAGDPFQLPSEEQLAHVQNILSKDLPSFFRKPLDLSIYHPNIIFEDNIRGKRFKDRVEYNVQSKLLYIIAHLRFFNVRCDVRKITTHPEDGTIKVRWSFTVFRLRRLRLRQILHPTTYKSVEDSWIEGFSTYYIMGDGLVHKHVVDKMIPDTSQSVKKSESPKAVPAVPLACSDRSKS